MLEISRSSARFWVSHSTFKSSSSRCRLLSGSSSKICRVTSSRSVCKISWFSACSVPRSVTVMRLTEGSFVADTVRLSMLKPRRQNRLEMRARTPLLLSTSRLMTRRVLLFVLPCVSPHSMMMSLTVPPPGIIGRTFSSLPMRQSIQLGPFCFIASANAALNSAGVAAR